MNEEKYVFGLSKWEFSNIIMRTMRKVMNDIWERRKSFSAQPKGLTGSGKTDYVTDADYAAQKIYEDAFRAKFPGAGFIGEENNLREACTSDDHVVFTLDPLDGTNAFVRGQSHGIATMVGVLIDGELAGGYIGDVMTGEIYAAEPGRDDAVHYQKDWSSRPLIPKASKSLREQFLLCRHQPQKSGDVAVALAAYGNKNRLYDDFNVDSGSIGLHFARLWKGEIGGFLIEPSHITPWDQNPCYAICKRLGIAQIGIDQVLWPTPYAPVEQEGHEDKAMLYLPRERTSELQRWYAKYARKVPKGRITHG